MTAEELKYVNLIFAEHEFKILKQETTIKKLKKSNKIKNNVIIGSMLGYFALLLVIL